MTRREASAVAVPLAAVAAVLALAVNLRAAVTGVGALLPMIEYDAKISHGMDGVFDHPAIAGFAAVFPFVGRASQRLGVTRLVVAALLVLAVGTLTRSLPPVWCLSAGTVVLSIGVAVGNVMAHCWCDSGCPLRMSRQSAPATWQGWRWLPLSIPLSLLFFLVVLAREPFVKSLAVTGGAWLILYGLFDIALGVSLA